MKRLRTLLFALVILTLGVVGIVADTAIAPVTVNVCAQAGASANVNGTPAGADTGKQCLTTGV